MDEQNKKKMAMDHMPTGRFGVCTKDESGQVVGFLDNWVQQVSVDPILISLSLKDSHPAYKSITEGSLFTVNIVGEHDKSYLKYFWKCDFPQENPFRYIPYQFTEAGAIVIVGSKSCLLAKKKDIYRPGDHSIVIADVLSTYVLENHSRPVVHLHRSGKDF